ncbi:hypothetical protein [Fibrella aquatica]|jgi:hypothetical protein|uniref:hypothetical protein n=1 Tax=Fibrella aquatica TaxID=3242487 RepID=UPI0035224B29
MGKSYLIDTNTISRAILSFADYQQIQLHIHQSDKTMNLQYLADHQGNVTGVFIPIKEWDSIRKRLDLPDESKNLHRQELLEAFEQMKQMREGKLPKPKLSDFLSELNEL